MPKEDKNKVEQQKSFWETRRAMLKSVTPYDEKQGQKDAKAALKARKDKK